MKTKAIFSALALAATTLATSARADVLTFEDLPSGRDFFTAPYHGFNFGNNVRATNDWFWTDGQPDFNDPAADPSYNVFYTPKSGTHGISVDASSFLNPPRQSAMSIRTVAPITFLGAYFSAGVNTSPSTTFGDTVQYQLFLGDTPVGGPSVASAGLTFTSTFVASGYAGLVDRIVIVSNNPGIWLMDDLTFTPSVPEPATMGLVLLGLLAVGAAGRRRNTKR